MTWLYNALDSFANLDSSLDDAKDNYDQVQNDQPAEGKFSHELIAGAAAFAGFRAFEGEQRKEG
jgi:hypothetical protein